MDGDPNTALNTEQTRECRLRSIACGGGARVIAIPGQGPEDSSAHLHHVGPTPLWPRADRRKCVFS